jgi:hypothetical protein
MSLTSYRAAPPRATSLRRSCRSSPDFSVCPCLKARWLLRSDGVLLHPAPPVCGEVANHCLSAMCCVLRLVSMLLRFAICKAKGGVGAKAKGRLEAACCHVCSVVGFEKVLNVAFSRPGSDLLSRVLRRSTIGAGAFHGRVRNGIGCSHPAVTTRSAKRNVS